VTGRHARRALRGRRLPPGSAAHGELPNYSEHSAELSATGGDCASGCPLALHGRVGVREGARREAGPGRLPRRRVPR
jgi:hypothetical protein